MIGKPGASLRTAARRARVRRRSYRRGAAMVETALTILLVLMLIFGMLDLGLAVFRHQMLSFAARRAVREAIVHGEYAKEEFGRWGPETVGGTDVPVTELDHPIAARLTDSLIGLDPAEVHVQIEWPAGNNHYRSPVRVWLGTTYSPMTTFILPNLSLPLSASSTMPIAH